MVNLVLVIVLLSGAIMATTGFFARWTMEKMTAEMISQMLTGTQRELDHFFLTMTQNLLVVESWGEAGLLRLDEPENLNRIFAPVIRRIPEVKSIILADLDGREHMLLNVGDHWLNRQTWPNKWGTQSLRLEWTNHDAHPMESWRKLDYDARTRPWFQGAARRWEEYRDVVPPPDIEKWICWTEPYIFFTTKDPGITASIPFRDPEGTTHIVGFDVLLSDISRYTMEMRVSEHAMVFVLTDGDHRIIGLPRHERYTDPDARKEALLKSVDQLSEEGPGQILRTCLTAAKGQEGPSRFRVLGQLWWGRVQPFDLAQGSRFLMGMAVPESDVLGEMSRMWAWITLITTGVLAVALWRAVVLARKLSRPVEDLVEESNRISLGNLDPGPAIESNVTEVRQLAIAHDRMRTGLQTLMKLEDDLKIAHQIQQNTLPKSLPQIAGFDIAAYCEPAEATGGDTYDVIGYRPAPNGRIVLISDGPAERAVLFLADATGHGVGPALLVTQVRAMLRMAIRMNPNLEEVVREINEQVTADLERGRFVTAWLGDLNAEDRTLTSLSLGQAPLIRYDSENDRFIVMEADAMPFGILPKLQIKPISPIPMKPGDLFAVLSDGMIDSFDRDRNEFGLDRTLSLLSANRHLSAAGILAELRKAVNAFTGEIPATDDSTAIIIKCTGR